MGEIWVYKRIGYCNSLISHLIFRYSQVIVRKEMNMEIKDSGNREEFKSGAVRDMQEGKGRCDLLPSNALIRLSKHFEAGAKKYGIGNWVKGLPKYSYISSAMRHLLKYKDDQDDEDHLAACAWNILCLMESEHLFSQGKIPEEVFLSDGGKKDSKSNELTSKLLDIMGVPEPTKTSEPQYGKYIKDEAAKAKRDFESLERKKPEKKTFVCNTCGSTFVMDEDAYFCPICHSMKIRASKIPIEPNIVNVSNKNTKKEKPKKVSYYCSKCNISFEKDEQSLYTLVSCPEHNSFEYVVQVRKPVYSVNSDTRPNKS